MARVRGRFGSLAVPAPAPLVDNRKAGRFELTVDGQTAVLQYERTPTSLVLVHTDVPPERRGRHLGDALVGPHSITLTPNAYALSETLRLNHDGAVQHIHAAREGNLTTLSGREFNDNGLIQWKGAFDVQGGKHNLRAARFVRRAHERDARR